MSARLSATPSTSFSRFAGVCALLSAPLAFGCLLLALQAVDFDFAALEDPTGSLGVGAQAARLVRWSMVLNLFGYYLLLAPAALYLHERLGAREPQWMRLFTLGGLGYILLGAMGSVILAAAWPPLISDYSSATGADRFVLQTTFVALTHAVTDGIWNILEVLLAGVWWTGIGLTSRDQWPAFAWMSVALGVACLLDAVGNILLIPALGSLGLNVYLVLSPLWALWLGVLILRARDVSTAR